MSDTNSAADALRASADGSLLRVSRNEIEPGWATGFLVAKGADFFALQIVDDGIRLNGFECMRYGDVTEAIPAPHGPFIERVLALRRQQKTDSLSIDLSSITSILESVSETYPLVTVRLEDADPDVCWIGRIVEIGETRLSLQLIDPDAEWGDVETYALDEITRVDFGGAYEDALALAAPNT